MRIDRWLELKRTKVFCCAGGVVRLLKRKTVKTDSILFEDGNSLGQVRGGIQSEQSLQTTLNGYSSGGTKSDQDHAGFYSRHDREQAREIQIHRQDDASFLRRSMENLFVLRLGEANLAGVNRIMSLRSQPDRCALRHGHVEQKLHAGLVRGREGKGFLAGQPGGVVDRLMDVFQGQVRIVPEDDLRALACREQVKNQMDGNAQASDASLSTELLRVHGNPTKTFHTHSVALAWNICQTCA